MQIMVKLVLCIHKFIKFLASTKIPVLPSLLNLIFVRLLFGCQIGVNTKLGRNVLLGYGGLGVVIHDRAIIGDNVNVGTGVTIGGTSKKKEVPVIGANTIISSGAKIIGPVIIGKNCVIGANAVVLKDIPDNCVVVGIPAKVIKEGININDYRSDL